MIDLEAIEDEDVQEKAMTKIWESDRKKAAKMWEAEEKAEQKEREQLEPAAKKASKKGKKKPPNWGDNNNTQAVALVPVVVAPSAAVLGSQPQKVCTRGTKRNSAYEQLTQAAVITISDEEQLSVHEYFLKASLDDVLSGESGTLPPS